MTVYFPDCVEIWYFHITDDEPRHQNMNFTGKHETHAGWYRRWLWGSSADGKLKYRSRPQTSMGMARRCWCCYCSSWAAYSVKWIRCSKPYNISLRKVVGWKRKASHCWHSQAKHKYLAFDTVAWPTLPISKHQISVHLHTRYLHIGWPLHLSQNSRDISVSSIIAWKRNSYSHSKKSIFFQQWL